MVVPDGGAGGTAGSVAPKKPDPISQLLNSLTSAKPPAIAVVTKKPTLSNGAALGAPGVPAAAIGGSAAQKPAFITKNAPLNPRAESQFRLGYDAFGLRRGAMIRMYRDAADRRSRVVDPKNRYQFQFLYNPSEISFGNSAFGGVVPPQYKNTNDNLQPMFVGQESVSFSLLLDRTQDAYEQGLSTRGTLDDVEALYRVINGDQGSQAGFLSMSGVEIHWGPSTQNGRPLQVFPGYVTNLSITHTHFTPRMCPIRTALVITANRIVGSNTSTTSAFTSAASTLGGAG